MHSCMMEVGDGGNWKVIVHTDRIVKTLVYTRVPEGLRCFPEWWARETE
jgi:hypothetical protein